MMSIVSSSVIHICIWESPWGEGNLVLPYEMKALFHTLARKASSISSNAIFDVVGLSWISQWDPWCLRYGCRLCQVLKPCSTRCRKCGVVRLTNQEEGRWASHCWKPMVISKNGWWITLLVLASPNKNIEKYMGKTHNVRHHIYQVHALLKTFQWEFSCPLPKF